MADPFDLQSQIETVAGGPASVSGDAGSVTAQPLAALIAADQYLAQKNAAGRRGRGLRFTRLYGPAQCAALPVQLINAQSPGSFS